MVERITDFYGRILGHYEKSSNVTKDFYGKILYHGDMASALRKGPEKIHEKGTIWFPLICSYSVNDYNILL